MPFELPGDWRLPTEEEIHERFEARIRRRWRKPAEEPPVDVFVVENEIWVEMDLPGVAEGEVSTHFEAGAVLVEAFRQLAPPAESARPARLERPRGKLRRRIPLPAAPRAARVESLLRGGVLRVRVVPEPESEREPE